MKTAAKKREQKWYSGANIPMRVIRDYARKVAKLFKPEKIILFGSYAYGTPNEDSDVDIMVVMPARNQIDQACKIDRYVDPPFALDLLVRTPKKLSQWLDCKESFHTEVISKGKVLYDKSRSKLGHKSRSRLSLRS